MILAVDIGNTNIVLGGYEGDTLAFSTRIASDRGLEADQYAMQLRGLLDLYGTSPAALEGAIVSSVVPQLTGDICRALERLSGIRPMLLSQQLNTGIAVKIDRPAELGLDLLAGAIGAKACYSLPAIIIDMGTATKITAVDADANVLGCSITPGVFISLNALTGSASQLGGIAVQAPPHAIGTNTIHSMQSGVVFGAAAMVDGMIDRFLAEMGAGDETTLVATGGAAGCVVQHCRHKVLHAPRLILDGLHAVYGQNAKN